MQKLVIVTGATRGLGLAITARLLNDGFKVIATGRQPSKKFEELRLTAAGLENLHFKQFDLEKIGEIHDFIKACTKEFGHLYGLINNAAIGLDGVLATMHETDIINQINVNVTAQVLMTKYAARSMLIAGSGRIVNISSIIASTGFNGLSVYAASKSALVGFTKSLARELGRAKITANVVAPGFMETDMTNTLQGEKLEAIKRRTPLNRLATVDDVAGAISFLLGPDAASITGTILTIDAGSTA